MGKTGLRDVIPSGRSRLGLLSLDVACNRCDRRSRIEFWKVLAQRCRDRFRRASSPWMGYAHKADARELKLMNNPCIRLGERE